MSYGYTSDNMGSIGYISKEKILQYVTEEKIFSLVFGYEPREFEYVSSPFRQDSKPGCWFERREDSLRFIDFASKRKFFPDCFDAVKTYYRLPNFYKTLEFIYERLIKGKNLTPIERNHVKREREQVSILIESRKFIQADADYWSSYGISRQNLIDDRVFPVSRYVITNTKIGTVDRIVSQITYAYTDFPDRRKKLYIPNADHANRFITNCTRNDIGCLDSLPLYGNQLIISKSYKDCRVIRNTGRTSVWFQNEGMIPDSDIIRNLVRRFTHIVVLFDNDKAGMNAAVAVAAEINKMFPGKAKALWLPETYRERRGITDPSDLVKANDYPKLIEFFNSYLI